ncbi:MAG: glycosyltransferase family 25 protein [Akkermansia sp.]
MEPTVTPDDVWSVVDAVIVINLDTRPDRWAYFQQLNAGKVPPEKLHRLSAVNGRELPDFGREPWFTARTGDRARAWGGVGGCILSHRKALRLVAQRGWRNALVVEDDVSLPETLWQWAELVDALRLMRGAWFLYLAYGDSRPYARRIGGRLWRSEGVLATYAYLVSAAACEEILPHLPTEEKLWEWVARYRAIDTWYRDFMQAVTGVRVYIINPTIAGPVDMGSDIASTEFDASKLRSAQVPLSPFSPLGLLRGLLHPLLRLKLRLNCLRTLRRARRGGLPGSRRKS